jgi:hypothetical protein
MAEMPKWATASEKTPVIPAKAGIHFATVKKPMDSRLRGNDDIDDASVTSAGMTT